MRNTIKWGQNNICVAWPNEEHNKIMTKQYLWPGLMRNTIKWGQNNICVAWPHEKHNKMGTKQ